LANNYAEAKKSYEQACEKDKNNPSYKFKIDDLEISKMMNNLKLLQQKHQTGDKNAAELLKKEKAALLEYRLKSYIERERQYSTDSRIRFDLGGIYFEMAEVLTEKGDTEGAKPLYDQAITRFQQTHRDPKFRNLSGLRLGLGFTAKGQYDLAIKRFDETLAGIPSEIKNEDWKTLSYAKADTLQKAGRNDDAKTTFLQIYEIDVAFKDVGKRVEGFEGLSETVQE
jgi:tetratricopeptide (TPR) repeat protein